VIVTENKFPPEQQIVIFTPIHRWFAQFSEHNVQRDEMYANDAGEYINSYVDVLKRTGELWSVAVIEFLVKAFFIQSITVRTKYVTDKETDRLHPNDNEHYRLSLTAQYQLFGLSATFKR
jgi:hypothetical protein